MLILASTLRNLPIIAPGTGKLGEIGEPIVDPTNGHVLGFTLRNGSYYSPRYIIATSDILALDGQLVILNNPESIIKPTEVVRIQEILRKKIRIMRSRALTENGKTLGKVNDVLINAEVMMISRYYIHHILQSRILTAEKVVRITRGKVIFSDDILSLPATPEGAAA